MSLTSQTLKRILIILFVWFFVFFGQANNLDSLIHLLNGNETKSNKAQISYKIGVIYSERGQYNDALGYLQDSYNYYKNKNKENKRKAEIADKLALVFFYLRAYDLSLKFAFESLDYYEKYPTISQPSQVLNTIGIILTSTKDFQKAMEYLDRALTISEQNKNLHQKIQTLNNISTIYYIQKNYKKSFEIDKKFLELAVRLNDSITMAAGYNNLGANYMIEGDLDSAITYYTKSLRIARALQEKQREAVTLGNIGEILDLQGKSHHVVDYFTQSLSLAKECGDRMTILGAYRRLSVFYRKKKKYKLSNFYLFKYVDLKDSINSDEILARVSSLQAVQENIKKTAELKINDEKLKTLEIKALLIKKEKEWIIYFTLGLFFLLILIGFRFYQKIKINKQRDLIQMQKINLQKLEIENREVENRRLKSEVEHKKKQLSLIAMNILHKSETIKDIENLVVQIGNENKKDIDKFILEIKNLLRSKKAVESDWKNFENLFNKVHNDFFEKLNTYTKLTYLDIRHCAYIKLQLSTKEIAGLFSITPKSVQIARVRLKKKLKLPKDVDLKSFIHNL